MINIAEWYISNWTWHAMNNARWKNKILKYFQSSMEYLHCVQGTLNMGPICGKTLSTDLKKACLGFLGCKKFRFSAGTLNGAKGRLWGAFYHRFYGGREGRMGDWQWQEEKEGRCYSEPKPPAGPERRLLARESYSPRIHPNRYDMLICILRIRQFTRINMLICFWAKSEPNAGRGEVGAHLFRLDVEPWAVARMEGGDRHTCICSSWTLGWTMEIWPGRNMQNAH